MIRCTFHGPKGTTPGHIRLRTRHAVEVELNRLGWQGERIELFNDAGESIGFLGEEAPAEAEVIKWFACGGGIAECGPFDSQVEAWEAMRLAPPKLSFRAVLRGDSLPKPARKHPPDTQVWPERVKIKPTTKKEKKS
jgi:hypothetical protein